MLLFIAINISSHICTSPKQRADVFPAGPQGCIQPATATAALQAALCFVSHSPQQCSGSARCLRYLLLLSCPSHFSAQCHKVHGYMLSYFFKGDFSSRSPVLDATPVNCASQGSKPWSEVKEKTYIVTFTWPGILCTVPIIKFPSIMEFPRLDTNKH